VNDGSRSESQDGIRQLQFVIAAGAFLRSTLAPNEHHPLDRHARKRIERLPWRGDSVVDIVTLRRRESKPIGGVERFVDWQHQWIVRAHTRQQWYASKNKHLPVIVAPYLKGREGKPLKVPAHSVCAVTR
jgi:hypothetical protein